jgi:hypothetical protein
MATQGKHNLVGEVFDGFVKDQINTRQRIYGSSDRSISEQQFLNNNGAFVRLVSSVDVEKVGTMEDFGEYSRFTGAELARAFVLQGGATRFGELPYGVTGVDIGGGFVTSNPAYGLGTSAGNPYGFSPIPHLTDVDVKSLNRGSLREANVNIVAYNPIQLNIIDALYLRLGYTVLLEWGHNILPNGSTNTYSLKDKILAGGYSGNAIRQVLDQTRNLRQASSGNYDAFFGKIKNYSWSFENDGSYKISLSIVSMGDVVESISVGSRYGKLGIEKLDISDDQKKNIKEAADKKKQEDNKAKLSEGKAIESDSEEAVDQLIFAESAQSDLNEYLYRCITFDVSPKTEADDDVVSSGMDIEDYQPGNSSTAVNLTDKVPGPKAANGGVNIIGIPFDGCANQDQYFIRLGWLLEFIEKNVLIYQEKGNRNAPLVNISYDADQNFCLTHKMQISADPRICVIGSKDVEGLGELHPGLDKYYDTNPVECGRLMNIYVSFVQIVSLLKEKRDEKGNVPLLDFLQSLMDNIASAMGGINTFEVIIDEDTNTLKILDNSKIPGIEKALEKTDSPAVFEIYGYKPGNSSFVKSISLKTEITNNLATEITVGAQAGGVVDGAVDASAPSLLNKGFKDRIVPEKTAPDGNAESKDEAFADAVKKFAEDKKVYDAYIESQLTSVVEGSGIFSAIYNFFADDDSNWDPELFDSCVNIQNNILKSDFIAAAKGVDGKASPTSGFIPLNLGLTFMGLSGMKIYEKFKINQNFLPRNYNQNIDFVLKGISHKIDKDGWFTSIESLSIPNNNNSISSSPSNPGLTAKKSERIKPTPKPETATNQSNAGGGTGGEEFPNNAPSSTAYTGGGSGPYSLNNQTLSASDQKNVLSQSRTITSNIAYTPGFKGKLRVRPKNTIKRIFIHHTAGNDSRVGVVNTFNATGYMCEFVLGRNTPDASGQKYSSLLEQVFDFRYFRGVCNSSRGVDEEIGIEICSYGGGKTWAAGPKGSRCKAGQRCLKMEGYGSAQIWVPESDTEVLVDINDKPAIYCGSSHAQAITPNMIKELEALLTSVMTTYNIPFTFETQADFDRVFPKESGKYSSTIRSITGICSHRMTTDKGKVDVMPTRNIIAMLKRLGAKFKNGAPKGSNNANPAAKVSVPAQFANANVGFRQGVAKQANQVPQIVTAAFAVQLLKKYKEKCKIEFNKNVQLKVEDPLNTDYEKGIIKDQLVFKKGETVQLDIGGGDYTIYIQVTPGGRVMFPLDDSGTTKSVIVSIKPDDIAAIIPT